MIGNIKEYIRNIVGMILSMLFIYLFIQFGLFRWLMLYVYNTPYWDRAFYSFHDMYVVIAQIHSAANSISSSHETIGYGLKVQGLFTLFFVIGSYLMGKLGDVQLSKTFNS